MRIGICSEHTPDLGGVHVSLSRHLELFKACHDFRLLFVSERPGIGQPEYPESTTSDDVQVIGEHRDGDLLTPLNRKLLELETLDWLARSDIEILHLFGCYSSVLVSVCTAAHLSGVPVGLSLRGSDLAVMALDPVWVGHLAVVSRFAAEVTVTNYRAARLLPVLIPEVSTPRVVHNSICTTWVWGKTGRPYRKEPSTIGVFGSLRPIMGLENLVSAFSRVSPSLPSLRLVLLGDPPSDDETYIERLVATAECRTRIEHRGGVPHAHIPDATADFDLVLFPSLSEGCPNKVLEAMVLGIPIVAAEVGGIVDLLTDGIEAVVRPMTTPEQIGDALGFATANYSTMIQYARAAQVKVRNVFTPERERQAWQSFYAGCKRGA